MKLLAPRGSTMAWSWKIEDSDPKDRSTTNARQRATQFLERGDMPSSHDVLVVNKSQRRHVELIPARIDEAYGAWK